MASRRKQRKKQIRKSRTKSQFLLGRGHMHIDKLLLALIVSACLLRLPDLGRQSLWVDEMCVYNDAFSGAERILNTVHPVTFLLARLSMALGRSEFFLRLPCALAGILSIPFIFLLARRLFGKETAYVAAVLLTFSPYHIYYSQDANYYSEMMFFSLLTYYLMFAFFDRRTISLLVLLILANIVNFKVHITNIFVIVSEGLVLLGWLVIDGRFLRERAAEVVRLFQRARAVAVPVVCVFLAGMGYVAYLAIGKVLRLAVVDLGPGRAENVEFSFGFFWKIATDYGIAFQDYSVRNLVLTGVVVFFFLVGLGYCALRRRELLFLVLTLFSVPFVALMVKPVGHFFHPRYTSFIVPLYVLCISQGLRLTAGWAAQRITSGATQTKVSNILLTCLVFAFLIGYFPNLYRYYTGNKQNWRGAVEYLRANVRPGEVVASYLFANNSSLQFYYNLLHMDKSPLFKLREVYGIPVMALNQLKRLCYEKPGVWLCSSYRRYEPALLFQWVEKYFAEELYLPSLHPEEINREQKEVVVYHWKYPERYVYPPAVYRYLFATNRRVDEVPKLPAHGILNAEEREIFVPFPESGRLSHEMLFESAFPYTVRLAIINDGQTEVPMHVSLDGREIDSILLRPTSKVELYTLAAVAIGSGVHSIGLSLERSTNPETQEALLGWLEVSPPSDAAWRFEAEAPWRTHPTTFNKILTIDGRLSLVMKRNSFADYEIMIPSDGTYGFSLCARNDQPGPVLLEMLVDDRVLGLLAFDKADDTWSTQTVPVQFSSGHHTLTIQFVNEMSVDEGLPPEQDNDAVLDYFILQRLLPGESIPDYRIDISKALTPPPVRGRVALEDPNRPTGLPAGWQFTTALAYRFESIDELGGQVAIRIDVERDEKSVGLLTAPFAVEPGKLMYFSAKLRVQSLANQSANIMVAYFNRGGQSIAQQWVNMEGITGSTDWVREVYLGTVPEGAARATIAFVVYRNSITYYPESGSVWISDFRFEPFGGLGIQKQQ
jgi:mannosyltransferase